MDELLQNQPRNARFLAWYAVTSLTHHRGRSRPDVARARGFLARLRTLEPDSARTAEVHARILVLDKQSAQAAGLLQTVAGRIVNKQSKLPETQLVQLRLIAKLCEQLKLTVAAEQLYQQQARLSGTPSDVLRQATFLGRQSRYKDGLAICRDAQKTCKPMAVAVTAVNVVSLGNPSRSDLVAAEQLVKIALAAEPKSVRIQMAYAGLLSAAGRLAESESRYREILQGSPDSIAMLNNLAWLLAMQEKDLLEASTLIERAIGQSGPLSTLLDTRGIILTKMGNATQAMADLKQALQEVDNPEVHLHLAQALLAAGDRTAAIASFREAKEKGLALARLHRLEQPGYHALLAALGENARKSGKPAKESP